MNLPSSSLLFACAALLAACANPKTDYAAAEKIGTIEAYEEFVARHPQTNMTASAKVQIRQLRQWKDAQARDDGPAYRDFLTANPVSPFTKTAQERLAVIEVKEAWTAAMQADDSNAYGAFLRKHPASAFDADARTRLAGSIQRGTPFDLASFVVAYPEAPGVADARARLATIANAPQGAGVALFKADAASPFAQSADCKAKLMKASRSVEYTGLRIESDGRNTKVTPERMRAAPGRALVAITVHVECPRGAQARTFVDSTTPILVAANGNVISLLQTLRMEYGGPVSTRTELDWQAADAPSEGTMLVLFRAGAVMLP